MSFLLPLLLLKTNQKATEGCDQERKKKRVGNSFPVGCFFSKLSLSASSKGKSTGLLLKQELSSSPNPASVPTVAFNSCISFVKRNE